jgi:large subunit ribosomal protein L30e
MKADIEKAINMAMSTGKVKMGYKEVSKNVLNGKLKATILSNNLPRNYEEELTRSCELSEIPIIRFDKSGKELGAACGRPHRVSMIGIMNPGNSKILDYID